MNKCISIQDRKKLSDNLFERLLNEKQGFNVLFLGKSGLGKQYVMDELIKKINDFNEDADFKTAEKRTAILTVVGDQIINSSVKYETKKINIEVGFSLCISLSLSMNEDNGSKINYLINKFSKVIYSRIILCLPNYAYMKNSIRNIIDLIIENKEFLEKHLKKKIFILISTEKNNFFSNFEVVEFEPYNERDIQFYIENVLEEPLVNDKKNNLDIKMKNLRNLTNSNLDLVNIIYKEILNNDNDFSQALSNVIERRLAALKASSHKKCIKPEDLEEIILTSSLSLECVNLFFIEKVTKKEKSIVEDTILLAVKENFMYEQAHHEYDFQSKEIKNYLSSKTLKTNDIRLADIYNYLTKYRTEDYFLRAYYLTMYMRELNDDCLTLLILALSEAILLNDKIVIIKIKKMLTEYQLSDEILDNFNNIIDAYIRFSKKEYTKSLERIKSVNEYIIDDIAKAELYRLKFKNYYLLKKDHEQDFKITMAYLKKSINKALVLCLDNEFYKSEEETLKLRIIFDLAPYVLDIENDYEGFQNLYTIANSLLKKEKNNNQKKTIANYVINVFNRKAFLFANPIEAINYYNDARRFFHNNAIWDEYILTLICQAGTCIVNGDYDETIELCEKAISLSEEKTIKIEKPEKLFNNKIIADFLLYEKENGDYYLIKNKVASTIAKLKRLLRNNKDETEKVILTNIASLSLYINDFCEYEKTKSKIETILNCENVANVEDNTIDDFYRYYFAWDEIYYHMHKGNWDKCQDIVMLLDNFVPTLFKKQEVFWKYKNEAVKELIVNKKIVNGYDFCCNLVKIKQREQQLAKFFFRGLMVSDLQYTSLG